MSIVGRDAYTRTSKKSLLGFSKSLKVRKTILKYFKYAKILLKRVILESIKVDEIDIYI